MDVINCTKSLGEVSGFGGWVEACYQIAEFVTEQFTPQHNSIIGSSRNQETRFLYGNSKKGG